MTNIEKLRDVVRDYQRYADKKIAAYNERADEIKSKYKPEVALSEIKSNIWPQAAGLLWSEKESAKQKIADVYEDILEDIQRWTLRPIKSETLTLLHSIHDFKVPLTINELKMIETEVTGNLIASKIFSGLAAEYGYQVAVPNADALLRELKELKSFAETAVDAYAGRPDKSGTFPGNDLLEPRKINGINHGEFAIWEKMIAADFVAKNASMQRAAELLEDSKVSLSYSLTEKETNRIKALIDDIVENSTNDKEKKTKMSDLLKSEPDMAAKIDLMGGEVKEAVVQCLQTKAEV